MAPSIDGYLRFHVDSKLVYDTLEGIVQKAAFDSFAKWKDTRSQHTKVLDSVVIPAKGIRTGCPDAPSDDFVSHGGSMTIITLRAADSDRGRKIRMRVTRVTMRVTCHCKMHATCSRREGPYNNVDFFPPFVSFIILYLPPSTTHSSLPPPPHIWILQHPQPNFIEGLDALFTHHLPRALHHPICLPDSHI
ncbi:hypothetical protein CK203_076435 [Vitis vinifera]|uniref:Uncharacterized protein n=1 Tax=Vitis vinifera TaxID=29760 RepID=A0A438C0K0_VITVI|nr:hypothetical protein CK203_076435 [Vitis vinifera]